MKNDSVHLSFCTIESHELHNFIDLAFDVTMPMRAFNAFNASCKKNSSTGMSGEYVSFAVNIFWSLHPPAMKNFSTQRLGILMFHDAQSHVSFASSIHPFTNRGITKGAIAVRYASTNFSYRNCLASSVSVRFRSLAGVLRDQVKVLREIIRKFIVDVEAWFQTGLLSRNVSIFFGITRNDHCKIAFNHHSFPSSKSLSPLFRNLGVICFARQRIRFINEQHTTSCAIDHLFWFSELFVRCILRRDQHDPLYQMSLLSNPILA